MVLLLIIDFSIYFTLVQEKKFSLFSFNHFQDLQGLWLHARANRVNECRPHVQHVLAPKTICMK